MPLLLKEPAQLPCTAFVSCQASTRCSGQCEPASHLDHLQQTRPYFDENDASNCTMKKLKARSETHPERKIQDHSPTKRSVAAVKIVQAMDPVEGARKVSDN